MELQGLIFNYTITLCFYMALELLPNSRFESVVCKGAHFQHWAGIVPLISSIIY